MWLRPTGIKPNRNNCDVLSNGSSTQSEITGTVLLAINTVPVIRKRRCRDSINGEDHFRQFSWHLYHFKCLFCQFSAASWFWYFHSNILNTDRSLVLFSDQKHWNGYPRFYWSTTDCSWKWSNKHDDNSSTARRLVQDIFCRLRLLPWIRISTYMKLSSVQLSTTFEAKPWQYVLYCTAGIINA